MKKLNVFATSGLLRFLSALILIAVDSPPIIFAIPTVVFQAPIDVGRYRNQTMKPELEEQKQIAAEAWAEAERKFLAAVKLKYAAGYVPTEREKQIGILVELFSLLYLRAKAGAREEALRIQFDIWAANAGVHRAYIDTIFVRAFGAIRVGTDYWRARRWCEDELYKLTEPV